MAARGQIELMTAWKNEFKKHKLQVAQILLSPSDAENKKSSKNAIATIENLISFKCIPIINENDTTSTDEIKFGDNDILASKISKLIKADHLILLSNVDGLYKEPPKNKKNDVLVSEIKSITKPVKEMAGTASKLGKGGMISKIKAAEICMKSKCSVIITSGLKKDPIRSLARKTTKSTRFISKPFLPPEFQTKSRTSCQTCQRRYLLQRPFPRHSAPSPPDTQPARSAITYQSHP